MKHHLRLFAISTNHWVCGLLLATALPVIAAPLEVPSLDRCFRRINIFTGNSDESSQGMLNELKRSGVLDCESDFWLFATQVHGWCHHPTAVGAVAKGIVKSDPVGDMVKELRKRHPRARVIAYMHPRTTYVLDSRKEWRAIGAFDGKPIDSAGPVACLSTGFVDKQLKPYLKELVDRYNFDGFWFDGAILNNDECGCAVCRAEFQKDTGLTFPSAADRDQIKPNYLRWMEWRLPRHEKHYDDILNYARTLRPDATVQVLTGAGRAWLTGEARPCNSEAMMRRGSESCLEFFWHVDGPGDPVYSHFNAQMGRGISGRLAEGWTPPTVHGTDSVGVPREELMARVWTMLVNGVVPQLPAGGWSRVEDLQQAFREIEARQAWLQDAVSMKYVALVAAENNDLAMPNRAIRAGLVPETLGLYRMLIEEHLPVDVIGRLNLEQDDLSPYRCIVLPEHYALGDRAASRLREFIRNGGGLVCSGRTGLFAPDGATLTNFALADLLGADFVSCSVEKDLTAVNATLFLTEMYSAGDDKLERSITTGTAGMGTGYGRQRGVSFWGSTIACRPNSAKEVLSLRCGEATANQPFLLRNEFGKGRVSFLAALIGESYDRFSYPYLRRIVAKEIGWTSGGRPPVEVSAPLSVRASYWKQAPANGKERVVVQLLNETAGQGRAGLTRGNWPIREEQVPVSGIKVRMAAAGQVSVMTVPDGLKLEPDAAGFYLLPPLGLHQMVVFELGGTR